MSTSYPCSQDEPRSVVGTEGDENVPAVVSPPLRNHDGTPVLNQRGDVVYRSQYLSTHPLRSDCMERRGSDGRSLTYVTGDGVIRAMNVAFGHGGWSTEITRERQVMCERDGKGKWTVGHIATVRVTIKNGASHEDCGTGESSDESKVKAMDTAFKSAITDAMKRAARHFGERLGNALYLKGSGIHVAPRDNKEALRMLEQSEANDIFGDQEKLHTAARAAERATTSKDVPVTGTAGSHGKENCKTPHSVAPKQLHYSVPTVGGFTRASELDQSTRVTPSSVARHGNSTAPRQGVGTDRYNENTQSTQNVQRGRSLQTHEATESPPSRASRPISSDGTHPAQQPPLPRYAPLENSAMNVPTHSTVYSQHQQQQFPVLKRAGTSAPTSATKRQKAATRNPYDRH